MVGLQLQSAGKEESLTAVLAYEGPGAVAADAALVVSLFSSTNHLASAATGLQTSSASDSRWKRAKAAGHAGVMTARWHKDVDRVWKRLCLACLSSHTLCAGILTRGSAGYTRAQTIMILMNSFAFELVMLCWFYSPPEEEPAVDAFVTINIVGIVVGGTFAAMIVIPTMMIFSWLYEPIAFVRLALWLWRGALWLGRAIFCWPWWATRKCRARHSRRQAVRPCDHARGLARSDTRASFTCRAPLQEDVATRTRVRVDDYDESTTGVSEPRDTLVKSCTVASCERPKDGIQRSQSSMRIVDASGEKQKRNLQVRRGAKKVRRAENTKSVMVDEAHGRSYSYESLNDVTLKASLTHSWSRRDWKAVRKILFGWGTNIFLFVTMILVFSLYGCELFEPRDDPDDPPAGNTDELILAWVLSAFQRFVLHEPTLILAAKGLPILFASAFCANCLGETIVNLLSICFSGVMACLAEIKG